MKILVTGAGGLVGSAVASIASDNHVVHAAYNEHPPDHGTPVRLNLLDQEKICTEFKKLEPDAIIHAAALTDVDRCEREPLLAEKVNHEATKVLAKAANALGAYFLYVSTDYVFDGGKGNYTEEDKANPISVYGQTKLRGERSVESSGAEYCVARGSVVYGSRPAAGKVNFALWVLENLIKGVPVKVLQDQYVSPTYTLSLARMVLEAAERKMTGTFHLAGATRASRYEFATELAKSFGLDHSFVVPVQMKDMRWLARRPVDSSLDVSKAISKLTEQPLRLQNALLELKRAMSERGT